MYQKNPIRIDPNKPIGRESSMALIHYDQSYYCDFENKEELVRFFEDIEGSDFYIGIETSDNLLEGLDSVLKALPHSKEKISKKIFYVEIKLKKADFIHNKALINFLVMVAEINDFVFIVVDPSAPISLVEPKTRKLIIDTQSTSLYAIFYFDAEGLIVFE